MTYKETYWETIFSFLEYRVLTKCRDSKPYQTISHSRLTMFTYPFVNPVIYPSIFLSTGTPVPKVNRISRDVEGEDDLMTDYVKLLTLSVIYLLI